MRREWRANGALSINLATRLQELVKKRSLGGTEVGRSFKHTVLISGRLNFT